MSSNTNIDPAADGKMIVNQIYHGAVITAFAMGYARLGKMAFGGSTLGWALPSEMLGWSSLT